MTKDDLTKPRDETPDVIAYAQAAELLGLPIGTLYSWVHDRRVPHIRLGTRLVRFSRRALTAWLASREVPVRDDQQ